MSLIGAFKWGNFCTCSSRGFQATRGQSWRYKNKIRKSNPCCTRVVKNGPNGRIFFRPPTLMLGSSAVSWGRKKFTTSFEIPDTWANELCLTMSLKHLKGIFSPIKESSFQYCLCSKGAISNQYGCTYPSK